MARPAKAPIDLRGIRQQPDGRWRVDVARSLPDNTKFRRSSAFVKQEDAVSYRDKVVAEHKALCEGIELVSESSQTVQNWCEHCISAILPAQANRRGVSYSPNTIEDYTSILRRHVYPSIGDVKLGKLAPDHLDLLMAGIPSVSIKANVKKVLGRLMTIAEERGKIARGSNPCKAIKVPNVRKQRTEGVSIVTTEAHPTDRRKRVKVETPVPDGLRIETVRVLSYDEEDALLAYVRSHPYHSSYETILLLGLRAGLRLGETLGLDWSAVDFDKGEITIDQALTRIKGEGQKVSNTKSDAGERIVPMTASLAEHLKKLKERTDSSHVIANEKGGRRDYRRVTGRLLELMTGAGLGDRVEGRRFLPRPTSHDLRRTCLTRLATGHVARGVVATPVPPTVLIRISGHEDVQTLMSYYVSADHSMVVDAMSRMP